MVDIDDRIVGGFGLDVTTFAHYAEKLASEWDGKDAGTLEDIAHVCTAISEKCNELEELLTELNQYA